MCDLACKTKIIIDGGMSGRVMQETRAGLQFYFEQGGQLTDDQAGKIHSTQIDLENAAYKYQRAVCDIIGYKGKYPHSLSVKV
jgi:hypothetical protein